MSFRCSDGVLSEDPCVAKCDEGYRCDICNADVEQITDSQLYLRFVIGELDPERLHTTPERHIRCDPVLAQFIIHDDFVPLSVDGDFDKRRLDPEFVRERERLVTRGFERLLELRGTDLPIVDYPLPEAIAKWRDETTP